MKQTLTYILSCIVSDPDKLIIEEHEQDGIIELSMQVPKEDIGKVIGKDGKVIRAIRNVLKILAIKHHKKIQISVVE